MRPPTGGLIVYRQGKAVLQNRMILSAQVIGNAAFELMSGA